MNHDKGIHKTDEGHRMMDDMQYYPYSKPS